MSEYLKLRERFHGLGVGKPGLVYKFVD